MKIFRVLLPAIAALALLGCQSTGNLFSHAPTPAQAISVLDGGYIASGTIAAQYVHLPRCKAPNATVICSDEATVVKIRSLDNQAYSALTAATTAVRTGSPDVETYISAAQAAIAALQTATINLKAQ